MRISIPGLFELHRISYRLEIGRTQFKKSSAELHTPASAFRQL
jgi:hypothetical protein